MKAVMTEKAVMMLESTNTITFEFSKIMSKKDIKKEVLAILDVKIAKIRTSIRNNKKYAYIKLKGDTLAIDVATKLGLM